MAINVEKFADEVEAKIGAEEAQLVRDLQSKLDRCEELLATAYQLAGLVGAPVRFLDAYSRQEGDIDSLLPVDLSELDEFKALQSRLDQFCKLAYDISGQQHRDERYWCVWPDQMRKLDDLRREHRGEETARIVSAAVTERGT